MDLPWANRDLKWAYERNSYGIKKHAEEAEARGYTPTSCDAKVQKFVESIFNISKSEQPSQEADKLKSAFVKKSVTDRKAHNQIYLSLAFTNQALMGCMERVLLPH